MRKNAEIAWAIRKDSPGLKAALNGFLATNGKDSLNGRMIFRRYLPRRELRNKSAPLSFN